LTAAVAVQTVALAAAQEKAAELERQISEVQSVAAAAVARAEAAVQAVALERPKEIARQVETAEVGVETLNLDVADRGRIQSLVAALERSQKETAAAEKENQSMSLAMDELQLKLRTLMSRAEESGDVKIRRLIEDTGFIEFTGRKNVWDRLYEEALERIRRTKVLCEEYNSKHGIDPLDGCGLLDELSGNKLVSRARSARSVSPRIPPCVSPLDDAEFPVSPTSVSPTSPGLSRRQQPRKVVRCPIGQIQGGGGGHSPHLNKSRSEPVLDRGPSGSRAYMGLSNSPVPLQTAGCIQRAHRNTPATNFRYE